MTTTNREITAYTYNDVLECVNATDTVNASFQTVLNNLYTHNAMLQVILACNEMRIGYGSGKELNRKLDVIRSQVKRTCKVHDVPVMGIKWNKEQNSFAFVATKEKGDKQKDVFKSAVATFIAKGATSDQKAMVMRLMTSLIEE